MTDLLHLHCVFQQLDLDACHGRQDHRVVHRAARALTHQAGQLAAHALQQLHVALHLVRPAGKTAKGCLT